MEVGLKGEAGLFKGVGEKSQQAYRAMSVLAPCGGHDVHRGWDSRCLIQRGLGPVGKPKVKLVSSSCPCSQVSVEHPPCTRHCAGSQGSASSLLNILYRSGQTLAAFQRNLEIMELSPAAWRMAVSHYSQHTGLAAISPVTFPQPNPGETSQARQCGIMAAVWP